MSVSRINRVARRFSRATVQRLLNKTLHNVGRMPVSGWRGVEALENRRLLAADTWTGLAGNGLWSSANNWNPVAVPAAGDVVTIDSGFTITISTGTAAIGSLNSASPLTLTGGTMTVTGGISMSANFTLNGGTISGSTFVFNSGAEMIASSSGSNVLDGDTIFGTLDLGTSSSSTAIVQVKNGLTMGSPADNQPQGGRILVGSGTTNKGEVNFDGAASQSLSAAPTYNVQVILANNSQDQVDNNVSASGGTVTLGAGVTVSGTQGFLNSASGNGFINSGTILANGGNSVTVFGKLSNLGTVGATGNSTLALNGIVGNLGTVSPITDTSTLSLNNNIGGSYTINNPISVTNGTLTILGTVTNQSTVSVSSGTLNLTLAGTSSNTGTISATNSTVNLRGDFSQTALGTFNRSGGTVNLIGTLENTSNTFALTSTTGPWTMDGGTIHGGTVSESGTGQLQFAASTSSIINGVTMLEGNLDLSQPNAVTVQIQGGLTVGPSPDTPSTSSQILIGSSTADNTLQFTGTASEVVSPSVGQTLEISFGGTGQTISNIISNTAGTDGGSVTFAPGVTIGGKGGSIINKESFADSVFINQGLIDAGSGSNITIGSLVGTLGTPLQNQGTLEVDSGGTMVVQDAVGNLGTVSLNGTGKLNIQGSFTNNLGLTAPSGSTLALMGTWTNAAPITATGATLTLGGVYSSTGPIVAGGTLNNTNTITATNSTTDLYATFTEANLGMFNRSGGTVNLMGTLTNTGSTLALNSTTGPWLLSGGTITGGTISESGTGQLVIWTNSGSGNNLLDGVTIDGNLDISQINDADTNVKDGLTIGSSPDTPTTPGVLIMGNAAGTTAGQMVFIGNVAQTIAPTPGNTMEIRFGAVSGNANEFSNQMTSGGSVGLPITLAPGVTLDGKNGFLQGNFATSSYINQGTINSSGGGTITVSAQLQNQGTIKASNGTLTTNQLTNLSSGTLTGGVYEADAHSTLNLAQNVTTDKATLILDGTSSLIGSSTSASALTHLAAISAGGSLSLRDGVSLTGITTTTLTNDGTISVGAGSTLSVTGALTQNADGTLVTQLASNTSFGKVTSTGAMTLNGGVQATLASGYDPNSSVTFTIASGSSLTQSATLAAASTPSGRALLMRFNTTSAIVAILPLAPSTPVMTAATDMGASQTDGITDDSTPSFAGSAQDAGIIDLFAGSTMIGTASISGGSWVVTTTPGLADGSYQVTAKVVDTAGDVGPASGAQTILIDTIAPTINAMINSAASTGWYNISTGPAVVSYTASDNAGGSGLAAAVPGNYTFADGANQSLGGVSISDIAGNTATSNGFSSVSQDTVAPSISASINSAASTGWYNIATGPAVVTYSAADGTSGLASAVPGAYTFADGTNQSLAAVTIFDLAGNSASSQAFGGIYQDTVAPTISATITSPDVVTGWYNIATGAAVVSYTASDNAGGSGLASAVPGSYSFADGTNQSLAGVTISDIAGNTATSNGFSGINQDTIAPTIAAAITSPDSSTDWYNIASGPAVVSYTASDDADGSGLASAVPGNYTFADGSNQSLAGATISDVAGNTVTSQGFTGINQDTVAPTINAAINSPDSATGWYNIATGPATVTYTASDSGSGLAFDVPGSYQFGDGANQSLDGVQVWDVAGNTAISPAFSGVNQDTVTPVIVATITSPDSSTGWYNIASGAAVVSYAAADNAGGSGLASAVPANFTFSDGANQSLAGVTVSDVAGNMATSNSFSGIDQDTVAPTISANINSPDSSTGWYNIATGAATVTYTASDNAGGSGLASAVPGIYTFADGANQSLAEVTISDIAGNTATSQAFSGIDQDTVAPTINATINSPASTGWYNIATGAAVVTYTASDSGSGLASAVPGSYTFADGANQSLAAVTISDIAGNTATSQAFSGINQDTVAPTITATISSPASTGWYNIASGPAVVTYTSSDGGSGLASAVPGSYTFADGANQSLAAVTISDVAGNMASSQAFSGIDQDTVAPTLTATINSAASTGWYNIASGPAVVSYTASDSGSGLASAVPGSHTFADGASQSLAAVTISDIAGNTATSQSFSGINQDTVAPTISASINAAASTGWYNISTGPAVVTYTASDNAGGSGLASAVPGSHAFADGASQSLAAVTISDIAGNSATSQGYNGINQDTIAPTISASINSPASTGWYNIATGPAVVHYTASDSGSGLATAVPGNHTFTDGANQSLAAVTISDVAGNTATSQAFSGINQDTVAPTISASINSPASTGWYNIATGAAKVTYSASDSGSGLASPVPASHTFADGANQSLAAVTISDIAGNTAASQTFSGIKQDTLAPTITATISAPASNGWYNVQSGPARVTYAASDGGSGLASGVPAQYTFADGTNLSLAGVTISDVAGNTAVSQGFSGIKQDTVAPAAPAAVTVTLSGTTPTYSGTAEAGSTVNIYADGGTTPVATVVAGSNGSYSVAGPALSSGSHSITATATDVAANVSPASQATSVTVNSNKATVLSTSVRWGTAGNIALNLTNGFLLPTGRTTDLPWMGINRIQITLSQSATLTAANVQVTGVNIANYGPVTVSGSGTQYTITFAKPVNDADRLTITIGNSKITTFTAKMNVLPGDVNDDGSVTLADINPELTAWLRINGAQPTIWEDVNGDGQVDLPDVIDTLISLNEHLPPQ